MASTGSYAGAVSMEGGRDGDHDAMAVEAITAEAAVARAREAVDRSIQARRHPAEEISAAKAAVDEARSAVERAHATVERTAAVHDDLAELRDRYAAMHRQIAAMLHEMGVPGPDAGD